MNWTDEEIDKLFQESASQMNVPYQDSFWTEMEALLPQKEKKKGLGWIFGGTLTCMALIAAMIFPVNQFSVETGKNTLAQGSKSNGNENRQMASTSTGETQENNQIQLVALSEIDGNKNAENSSNGNAGYRNREMNPAQINPVQTNPAQTTRSFKIASERQAVQPGTDNMSVSTLDNTENTSANPTEENGQEASAEIIRLPLLGIPNETQELAGNKFATFKPRAKTQKYYAQAGFGISQSYLSGTDKNWMPAVNIGAGYQYRPKGFGFSAGLNISSSFSNNLEIMRRSKIYNFSSTNYEQLLRYKQLYSIELPVSIDFRANKHVFSIGIAPTYLATSVMRFSQAENGQVAENGNYIGQRVGLKSFGLKPSISYQMEVSNSWYVGIQLNAQVINQIDQTQFIEKAARFPLSGQITLRKTLSR